MVFKWREEHINKFLDLYREYECLWNVNSELYKNKTARDVAYQKICNNMNLSGLTIADVKNKIKIIRTNYKTELNKIQKSEKSGNSLSDIYTPRLFWFHKADLFLRRVSTAKNSTSNLDSTVIISVEGQPVPKRELKEDDLFSVRDDPLSMNNNDSNLEPKFSNYDTHRTSSSKRVGKKRMHTIDAIEHKINKLQHISDLCRDTENDEFDFFGKSIAVQLRKLPLDRAFFCEQKIQEIILQERLNLLHHQSRPSTSTDIISSPPSSACSYLDDETQPEQQTTACTDF